MAEDSFVMRAVAYAQQLHFSALQCKRRFATQNSSAKMEITMRGVAEHHPDTHSAAY
jgi:hypothetical protein